MKRTLYMETTTIDSSFTVAEIQRLLSMRGARRVNVEYDNGVVTSVNFSLMIGDQDICYTLPCRWQAIEKYFKQNGRKSRRTDTMQDWARRVAWRQVLRWVEAQLALIETGMVTTGEVFFPYAVITAEGKTQTMHQFIEGKKYLAIGSKNNGTENEVP